MASCDIFPPVDHIVDQYHHTRDRFYDGMSSIADPTLSFDRRRNSIESSQSLAASTSSTSTSAVETPSTPSTPTTTSDTFAPNELFHRGPDFETSGQGCSTSFQERVVVPNNTDRKVVIDEGPMKSEWLCQQPVFIDSAQAPQISSPDFLLCNASAQCSAAVASQQEFEYQLDLGQNTQEHCLAPALTNMGGLPYRLSEAQLQDLDFSSLWPLDSESGHPGPRDVILSNEAFPSSRVCYHTAFDSPTGDGPDQSTGSSSMVSSESDYDLVQSWGHDTMSFGSAYSPASSTGATVGDSHGTVSWNLVSSSESLESPGTGHVSEARPRMPTAAYLRALQRSYPTGDSGALGSVHEMQSSREMNNAANASQRKAQRKQPRRKSQPAPRAQCKKRTRKEQSPRTTEWEANNIIVKAEEVKCDNDGWTGFLDKKRPQKFICGVKQGNGETCQAAFKKQEHQRRHRSTVHADASNFPCCLMETRMCDKTFTRQDNRRDHYRTHLHTNHQERNQRVDPSVLYHYIKNDKTDNPARTIQKLEDWLRGKRGENMRTRL